MHLFRANCLKVTITLWLLASVSADACAAVMGIKEHVVNADQSVIIIWDKQSKAQHFIRKADFKTDADELGLPESTGPQRWWLTNIEDLWPYEQAKGDVYFSPVDSPRSFNLDSRHRPVQLDASLLMLLALGGLLKLRRLNGARSH